MFVIGTAGHVDHGKSTLVRALTGIDPDRLAEEKAREMTIDLGFAWLKLPSGREVSVIDVPGHEHFIKNMLAGVGGMDLAMLVVDAVEGVMPQTREHLAILDLIGVQKGIVVLTKTDIVDKDQLSFAILEVEELLQPTSLSGSPIVPVSSVTGQGLPELIAIIDKQLSTAQPRQDIGRPRLPVDRAFSIAGAGTVVTGTLIDGSLSVGQEVEIVPSGLKSRIRSLQTHKTQLSTVSPGSRVAANVVGISASELKRGDVVTKPGWLTATDILDAKLRLLSELKHVLRHYAEVSFHTGAAEVTARVRLLEKDELQPGETGWVQLVLSEPIAVVNGDRFIIRSPMETLGGGVVVETHPRRHRRFRSETVASLKVRGEGKAEEVVTATLEAQQPQELSALLKQLNMPAEDARELVESMVDRKALVQIGDGQNSLLFTASGWAKLVESIVALVSDYHRKYPVRLGMPKAELSGKVKLATPAVLHRLFVEKVLVEEFALERLPAFQIKLTPAQQAKIDAYLKQLAQNPYSPAPDIVLEPDLLNLLMEQHKVVKTSAGIVFSAAAYDDMVAKVIAHIKKNGKAALGEVRDMFRTSRKYAQAFLEHTDEKKVTKRVGDERVLGERG